VGAPPRAERERRTRATGTRSAEGLRVPTMRASFATASTGGCGSAIARDIAAVKASSDAGAPHCPSSIFRVAGSSVTGGTSRVRAERPSTTPPTKPEWLQIDLGQTMPIDGLVIHWEAAYATHYEIQVSDDAKKWTAVATKTDGRGGKEVLTGLGGRGRYVRIYCQKFGPHPVYSIWEVEFLDKQTTQAIAETRRKAEEARLAREREGWKYAARRLAQFGVEEIVFAVRQRGKDGHWYANFSYYSYDDAVPLYGNGGKLCVKNFKTGLVRTIVDDPEGGVRDPVVHYDAKKVLFSYRPGGTENYHLWEINLDGTGLRQLTDGPFDDFEPGEVDEADGSAPWEDESSQDDEPAAEPTRPFEHLGTLPSDLSEAFEAFKLAIIHHRLAGWQDVSCDTVLETLNALKQLALAPTEDQ